ncbi:MAG TPA: energy-coupling factor transporter transmembrane component T, partial [Bacillota bacterium]|nr:energy-coupling factor transporter transmembrane component T [Bacillota bacterium]
MLNDITLGQYFPGSSLLHKADARFKLLSAAAFLASSFIASSDSAFLMLLALTAVMIAVSSIPVKTILKSLKPLLFIMCFTAIISLFWTSGDVPVFEWKFIHIYKEGISLAVFMVLRLVCIISI